MITIRFANGNMMTYNNASGTKDMGYSIGIMDKDGYWIAQVPKGADCVIEAVEPCRLENPLENLTNENAIRIVAKRLRGKNKPKRETAVP